MSTNSSNTGAALPSSFRDPAGFMFTHRGTLYRQVNQAGGEDYDRLMDSGLYDRLVADGMLVPHREVAEPVAEPTLVHRTLAPEVVDLVSYPYEWCFSQLRDAALLTLDIQLRALEHDQSLKDASAYNIQFHRGRPVLIDTLSFEGYSEGRPWVAYRQFCQHFLAPLALMARTDVRLGQLLRVHLDGIPLDLAARLLPASTRLRPGLLMHLHLHARTQKAYAARPAPSGGGRFRRVSRTGLTGLLQGLRGTVAGLDWQPAGTEWAEYYRETNYSDAAFEHKRDLVREFLAAADPGRVWDLGANTGVFSRLAADRGVPTAAFDIDPAAVEIGYRRLRQEGASGPLPLLLDLTNPSPALGWNGAERDSLMARGPVDCAMALALVHHLAISNNVPLAGIAAFFAGLCEYLIIEFVPKSDSQVQRLLRSREDIFPRYDHEHFEAAFREHFSILRSEPISGSQRTLYLMHRNGASPRAVDSPPGSH